MQIVMVKFLDPTTFGHWASLDDLESSKPHQSVASGFLWSKNDEVVRVGLLASPDKTEASNWITIPIGCVKSIEVIKEIDWDD